MMRSGLLQSLEYGVLGMACPERLQALYQHVRRVLGAAGIVTADLDARVVIQRHTGCDWASIVAMPEKIIARESIEFIEQDVQRRLAGEPLSRIYGQRSFWGLDFSLGPDTLDPRPDSETIIDAALLICAGRPPASILDLGTGTGCLLISLLHEWPQAKGIGIDRSYGALCLAKQNAAHNGVAERSSFLCGSWGEAIVCDGFDLIVSNPPYIPNPVIATLDREVRNHDPILALDGGPDGLDCYRTILSQMPTLLKRDGRALFEMGFDQRDSLVRLVEESGLKVEDVHPDLSGKPRVVEISRGDN